VSDAAKGAASVVLFLAIVAMAYAANTKPMPVSRPCVDIATKDRIKTVMIDGFEIALKEHVKTIFDVFLRDHADTTQRAANGLQVATAAYVHSRAVVMAWDPPECKP